MKQNVIIENGEIKLPNENVSFDITDIMVILEELWQENSMLRAKCCALEEEKAMRELESRLTIAAKCS